VRDADADDTEKGLRRTRRALDVGVAAEGEATCGPVQILGNFGQEAIDRIGQSTRRLRHEPGIRGGCGT
jgi:hypothetical protein